MPEHDDEAMRELARELAEANRLRAAEQAREQARPVIDAITASIQPKPKPTELVVVGDADVQRWPGRKSKWRPAQLEAIAKRIANGDKLRDIEKDTGIRHQRISELKRRGDVRWDAEHRQLVTPPGTIREGGWVILPPRR